MELIVMLDRDSKKSDGNNRPVNLNLALVTATYTYNTFVCENQIVVIRGNRYTHCKKSAI